jgi:hypothetical protein
MLVCRSWRDIMLSTPGIRSKLQIRRTTEGKHVHAFIQGRSLLDVTIDMDYMEHPNTRFPIDPHMFCESFVAAAEAASRWRSLELVSHPCFGVYKDLHITQPLQQLESFKVSEKCNLGDFLVPLMTAITKTVTPRLTLMELFHPDAALYLVQTTQLHIFSSLTTFKLICRRMQNPVDILPYLHNLEVFVAHHIFLPMYPPNVDLPLVQSLRVLHLKSVSIQWMESQIFPALQECSIIFPYHDSGIRSVHMPSCSVLKYASNNLGTLEHFHLPPLARLEVKCGQLRTWSGNLQLAALHHIFAPGSLTCLHLQIHCSEQLLAYMLGLVPTLEELWMGLSSPHALSKNFFLAFAAGRPNAIAMIGPPGQNIAPLCRQLKKLDLHYKRWLRGSERKALIPAFGDIMASHRPEEQSGSSFSLRLSFDEGPEDLVWRVHGPVDSFDIELGLHGTYIGFSGPHGIIPLSTASGDDYAYFRYFRELEYIMTDKVFTLPIDDFLAFNSLREVRVPNLDLEIHPFTQVSSNLPLFHTLKVLHVRFISSSFLAGQKFHKLARYKEQRAYDEYIPQLLTEMPICTRLVVQLSRLATLKLPQIHELGVCIDGEEANYIWENHITVNVNLSGLKLLHLWAYYDQHNFPVIDIIRILKSLPALETLVIDGKYILLIPYIDFFREFVPMGAQGTSGSNQSCRGGQISGLLCPGLKNLQIQDIDLIKHPKLVPVLEDIVTLRATIGAPLNSFTFYHWDSARKWELIGVDKSFVMDEVVPALRFELDI